VTSIPSAELADLARLSEGDEDPATVLHRIVTHATTLVPGCTGAGLTVRTREGEQTAAVTDDRVEACHAVQFRQHGAGPACEAMQFGEPRRCDRLAEETRWPEFVAVAREQGFGSCLALPLPADRHAASALNLYAERPGVFAGTTFDVALLFAAQGGVALDNADLYRRSREWVEHLHRTLTTRSVIERAKGVLMSRHEVSSEDAFDLLREQSQRSHQKLHDVARSLLRDREPGDSADPASTDAPWTPPRRSSLRPGAAADR
jgi:GAF domain-containing protein